MILPRLSNLEMQIMEALWTNGDLSIREIQEKFPQKKAACLHDSANNGAETRGQEGGTPRQEDFNGIYF
jgi:hypothetical protein